MNRDRNVSLALALLPAAMAIYLVLNSDVSPWWAVGLAVIGAVIAVSILRRGKHTPWSNAKERLAPGHAVVFWKPGCRYCVKLMRAIGDDERVTWVNVWADKQANMEVRRHNNGDELTPTALVGDRALRNPDAEELLSALAKR